MIQKHTSCGIYKILLLYLFWVEKETGIKLTKNDAKINFKMLPVELVCHQKAYGFN